ncbi:bifunctional 5,10-methylenetetrahydrofolate dehydrogenase/5,10-methenyltetrahydrofolate cyclohydrolase [Candidatus Kaiserbacteria bacterium]|nr:bifunctional 5,10-methylenetetrahydrofolate dehydrogenase/5,10-methenyltetrahydrofolate cyclohydrolase [Candidatus Kaiserbacteria bacterium]
MAKEILARAKARAEKLARQPKVVALVCNETPATKSYLAIKSKRAADAGCVLEVRRLNMTGIQENERSLKVVDSVRKAAGEADALIVQLPLPEGVDTKAVCDAIPIEKDADVLSSAARAGFEMKGLRNLSLLPPVVGAVREIFVRNNVGAKGKKAVVIGAGFLVGAPVATWLTQQGADVRVLTIETNQEDFTAALRASDIIVSGAGSPHIIKPEMLKEGVILIDAGTSESSGVIVGDTEPACAAKCSLFTPVPGGVGPLAVACLFENVVMLAEQKNSSILSS